MSFPRVGLAGFVGLSVAALALAGNIYRRGLPDFIADWVALAVSLTAVGLASAIVTAWLRGRVRRRVN